MNRKHAYLIGSCHQTDLSKLINNLTVKWADHRPDILKLVTTSEAYALLNYLHLPCLLDEKKILLLDSYQSRYLNKYLTPVSISENNKTARLQVT